MGQISIRGMHLGPWTSFYTLYIIDVLIKSKRVLTLWEGGELKQNVNVLSHPVWTEDVITVQLSNPLRQMFMIFGSEYDEVNLN